MTLSFWTVTLGPLPFILGSLTCLCIAYKLLVWLTGGER